MVYKIVKGNEFNLHILVSKMDLSCEFNRIVDCDLSLATNISVDLSSCFCDAVEIKHISITGISHNVIVCHIPNTLEIGRYNVRVSFKINGISFASVERNLLQIVPTNSKTKIPIGIVEGEATGMFNLRYYVVTDNISYCTLSYQLSNLTISSSPETLKNGDAFEASLKPDFGYNIGIVKIAMNGKDITNVAYKNGHISIPAVSGFVMIMATSDEDVYYTGATATDDISKLDLEELTKHSGDIYSAHEINIETTEDKPFVFIATRVPVLFTQAGFDAAMHCKKVGCMWFYWSDELTPGSNVYYTKLK